MALAKFFQHPLKKKGIFFTFLSITLVSLIMLYYTQAPARGVSKDNEYSNSQFMVFDSFSRDISEVYAVRVLNVQSTMSVMAMLEHINKTHTKISDLNATYRELMFKGSINNQHQAVMKTNLSNWTYTIYNISWENFKIRTNVTFYNLSLVQTDPWHIIAISNVSVLTKKDNMQYLINKTINTTISIIGFKDPMYLFNNKTIKTIHTIKPRVTLLSWQATTKALDASLTHEMVRNQTYIHTKISPSFLMRIVNNTNASDCCGIESLINYSSDIQRSYVDYLFFNNITICGATCIYNYTDVSDVDGSTWFRLDIGHESIYGLTLKRLNTVCGPGC
jgi:hypothetical protein